MRDLARFPWFPSLRQSLASSRERLTQWRLPSQCAVCRRVNTQRVCADCLSGFSAPRLRCCTCALPLPSSAVLERSEENAPRLRCGACLSLGSALDDCHAAVDYAYPWSGLVQSFKYSDAGTLTAQPGLARSMAQVLRHAAAADAALAQAMRRAQNCDWIIPVALHPERMRERGFNQAQALARAFFPSSSRIRSDLLLRIKNTAPQASLPHDERSANLRAAFAVEPRRAHELKNTHICLIDDVSTTGSTLQAAAQTLHTAGARQIQAIVFARTALE